MDPADRLPDRPARTAHAAKAPADPLPTPAGDDDDDEMPPLPATLVAQMLRLPRHLSIHSGGMVLCDRPGRRGVPGRMGDDARPQRPAVGQGRLRRRRPGEVRPVGPGHALRVARRFGLLRDHHDRTLSLHTVPDDDAGVYDMLCDADSVGVFQVESRAQMATLPRLKPRKFYDLVVEVALIRPGPIQGGSVHPFIRRANRRRRWSPSRTDDAAGARAHPGRPVVPGADDAVGHRLRRLHRAGVRRAPPGHELQALTGTDPAVASPAAGRNGDKEIPADIAEDIYSKLFGFASYGFPESHAYSFAYLVYASAYLKRYYPAAFTVALLNNQPMGFYMPQSLIADARRHGVVVRGVDVNASAADATLEEPVPVSCSHPHAPE